MGSMIKTLSHLTCLQRLSITGDYEVPDISYEVFAALPRSIRKLKLGGFGGKFHKASIIALPPLLETLDIISVTTYYYRDSAACTFTADDHDIRYLPLTLRHMDVPDLIQNQSGNGNSQRKRWQLK